MVYCVGLTGNIASGKTTVAQLFAELGIDVLSADSVARELTLPGHEAYEKIVAHYGIAILQTSAEIDRRKLRDLIFNDDSQRLWLEQLLHPLIREQLAQQVNFTHSEYAIVEIPLLKDKSLYPYLDRVLVITSSPAVQIARVMARDHCSKEQAQAILRSQPGAQERLNIADDLLVNDGEITELREQVLVLNDNYLQYAREKIR